MLESSESLEYLKLTENRGIDFPLLAPSISKLITLRYLDLNTNRMDTQGCRALAIALPGLMLLERLIMNGNEIDNEGCSALAPALASMKSLHLLNLADNQYGVEALHTLIIAAQSIQSLRQLVMGNCNQTISKETCREIFQALASMQYGCKWSVRVGDHQGQDDGIGCYRCNHEFGSNNQNKLS
jgi:Ran GTPase-activating protein (RanGAP) involved in mRNA processing and transport